MNVGTSRLVRNEYKSLEASEILSKPVDCLLGVSALAKEAISRLGISTVFDLASSQTFAAANEILDAANGSSAGFGRYGRIPGELVDDAEKSTNLKELPLRSIEVLRCIGPATRKTLESALDVGTIRDFSLWPPYHAAREILSNAYGLTSFGVTDVEAPSDLIPANGQYPTERVQYEVILFEEYVGENKITNPKFMAAAGAKLSRPLGTSGPLDISELLAGTEGFDRPAIGGILTFKQSWYTKGLALGNLIHGVALAPGESTKIAMIDWSRKTRSSATEAIQEDEALDSDMSRSRGISEITSSVAKETQQGNSGAHNNSMSTQFGTATGSASFLTSLVSLPGVNTSGTSSGFSSGSTDATSWSTSSGERDISAKLTQDIVDRTQQASHSARNRRASIIREVSQSESEKITTRTLTNYNHMHALTVEYYEVVQLYRTVVELSNVERCLFVPMKLIDFRNVSMVDRYRRILSAAALSPAIREALEYPTGTTRVKAPAISKVFSPQSVAQSSSPPSPLDDLSPDSWTAMDIHQGQIVTGGIIKILPDGRLVLPSDAIASEIDFVVGDKAIKPDTITIANIDGTSASSTYGEGTGWDMAGKRMRIDRIAAMSMTASNITGSNKTGFLSIIFSFKTKSFRIVFPVKLEANTQIPIFYAATIPIDVISHFQDHRLYYSQAIWRSLEPSTIGIMLSDFTWPIAKQERPLVEVVDPRPVAISANYLVFRLTGETKSERDAWISRKKFILNHPHEDLVPVPSGGVFAEAVLGRFNSAEKLDITRFWNWQDSPIPIQAPDIAAIQSGSRRDPDGTTPGQLGSPVLNIVSSPALPDPQGMGAVLAAIQNGNMFRDMSGLAATIGLAQSGLAGAQQGASDASAQAGKNAAVAAELGAKVAEIAAKLIASYFTGGAGMMAGGGGGGGGGSGQGGMINADQGISKAGSILNYAKGMDDRTIGKTPSGQPIIPASDLGGGGGLESATYAATANQRLGSEGEAFDTVLGGSSGIPGGSLGGFLSTVTGSIMGASSGTANTDSSISAWKKLDHRQVTTRLMDLRNNANLFNQGGIGLCTAAAFYHNIIQKNPIGFGLFAKQLHAEGMGYLNKLKIAPGDSILNVDYNILAKNYGNMPPQADWMLMAALRDSQNWFLNFDGAPDENVAFNTSASELSEWYNGTGFYSTVVFSNDTDLDEIKKVIKSGNNHVALWIKISMLGDPRPSTHIITLESPLIINEAANSVTFDYWTWGQPVKSLQTTLDNFKSSYLGAIIANF